MRGQQGCWYGRSATPLNGSDGKAARAVRRLLTPLARGPSRETTCLTAREASSSRQMKSCMNVCGYPIWSLACSDASATACNSHSHALCARYVLALQTLRPCAPQLLHMDIASSSSSRNIPCSTRNRRWRRHYRGKGGEKSAMFSEGRLAGVNEVSNGAPPYDGLRKE